MSGRGPGDFPDAPADGSVRRHVLRFEVEGSMRALMSQAQDEHRRRTGQSADDDALVTALVQAFMADGDEASCGAAAQVMVTLCPECREGTADAGGRSVALGPAELETLCCDAQVLPTAQTERGR